jgi:hypothetical protein
VPGADGHRNHVGGDRLTKPDAGIEPAATVSISASLMMISTLTSGKLLRKRVTIGSSTSCVDCRAALKRSVPAGLPRKLLRSSSASSISRNAGLIRENSRSPASVSATLRVVRLISRRSSRSSMLRSAWLSAEAETPSSVAARESCGAGRSQGRWRGRKGRSALMNFAQ